jgi:hypothetical protein
MATWCVYHLIHVRTPWQYIPRLVITDVPDDTEVTTDLLERAGYQYEEFGVPWANHGVERLDPKSSPSDLVARVRNGAGERIRWSDLVARAEAPL